MNLFVIYIGGSHKSSLIELHDIRFIVANSIEETYGALRESWWGIPKSLHIDAWGILKSVDGYQITITTDKSVNKENTLFFVNLGGYDHNQFTELHKNIFVVASNEIEAKQKALKQVSNWKSAHRDNLYEIDSVLNMDKILMKQGYYLKLAKEVEPKSFDFSCCYIPIGRV